MRNKMIPTALWKRVSLALFIGLAGLVVSCEKEIPYNGPDEDPKMVVNCIAVDDSVFYVRLERSQFFLDNGDEPFPITSGATVQLTDLATGLIVIETEADSIGRYVLPLTAVAGNSYSLKVTHPQYGEVTTTTTIPYPVEILTMDTVMYASEYGGDRAMATITFQDLPGKSYYGLMVIQEDSSYFGDYEHETWVMLEDPLVEDQGSGRVFFDDKEFDGELKTLKFSFDYFDVENPKPLKVRLYSCNPETFTYFLAVQRAAFGGPFSEPVKVPSNVNNGYGFFGATAMIQRLF